MFGVWSAANGQQMNGKETTDGQEGRNGLEEGGREGGGQRILIHLITVFMASGQLFG